jgi:hypothetical protein
MQAPQTQKLYDLFVAGRLQYVVPVYQRAYTWDEDNWIALWEDLEIVLEHRLEGGSNPPSQHFLGAVVIELQHFPVGGMEPRFLIDGQQRLTTTQMLLAAAATVLDERAQSGLAGELRALTINTDQAAVDDARFKIWPGKSDRAHFKAVIDPDVPTPELESGVAGAYHFFRTRIDEWLDSSATDTDDDDPGSPPVPPAIAAQRAAALHTCLRDLVYVVTINLDESDNSQVIFETLNARGTPLSALDLAKNALFLEAEREGADVEALHDQHWQPIFESDDYWGEEETQGREKRPRGDWFLFHWLAMELERVVGTSDLFSTFRREKLRRPGRAPMTDLVPSLCRDAVLYRAFGSQPLRTPERLFFARLSTLDTTTVFPLALLLYRSPDVTLDVRRRSIAAVESWLVRRALLRYQSRAYNRLMPRLLRAAKADLARADERITAELRSWTASSDIWPSDADLRNRLLYERLYDYVGQGRVRMALAACEMSLRNSPKTEPVELPEGLSIEHAMPQKWDDHWLAPAGDDPDEAIAQREAHLDRLGNLTLVTTPLNSSMQNAPWTKESARDPETATYEKREELRKHSVLLLNQHLATREVWDESAIAERGEDLFERIAQTWPGPTSADWDPLVVTPTVS